MRTFLSIKYHPDHRNRFLIERIISALNKAGLDSFCVVRDIELWGEIHHPDKKIMELTLAEIDRCQLFVVDLSEKGVGLGIEAGYAYARGKPVWVIAHQGVDISPTLLGIVAKIFYYSQPEELSGIWGKDGQTR